MIVGMTLGGVTQQLSIGPDPQSSELPVFSDSRNDVPDTAVTPSGDQLVKRKRKKEVNLQKITFTTPPLQGPSTLRLERTVTFQLLISGSVASPISTITRGIKETEAIRADFGRIMAKMKWCRARLMAMLSDLRF